MLAIVFDPARFGAAEHYARETREFIDYVQSARRTAAGQPIEVPGDAERRYRIERANALPVDGGTLRVLDEASAAINKLRGTTLSPASALAAG
jgi:LDH2 family malate/lactate/ureidoglycolate dehydrogenase